MNKKQFLSLFATCVVTSALVSGGTVAGAMWYLNSPSTLSDGQFSFLESEPKPSAGPKFHALDNVIVSVRGKKQTHFVMLELALETRHIERLEFANDYMPKVRHAMLNLFSQKRYEDLHGADALDQLQREVKASVMTAYADTQLNRDIDDVLLTKFVIQ
ncbi:flagellar basal body-associated FliL family protein [Vibrio maritimus]|uniref:Flagellar protein FliL n=1 Tax=Vibrio chaetopteri TaxID=3016528 RepID=A0AAU8BIH4_9VIBR